MTLGYNPNERGISLKSASKREIDYLERRFSEMDSLLVLPDIKTEDLKKTEDSEKLPMSAELFFREIFYFYSTYVQ